MKRRQFLTSVGKAGLVLPCMHSGMMRAFAAPTDQLGHLATESLGGERILVVLRMFGGNDGLNTIVPIHDDEYYRIRNGGRPYDLSIARERVLPIPEVDGYGMHPSMAPLMELYKEGCVAVVQGVGYPNMDLSHFRGTDVWLSASDANVYQQSGWLGRMFDMEKFENETEPYAIEYGDAVGRLLHGSHEVHGHTYHASHQFAGNENIRGLNDGHGGAMDFSSRFQRSQLHGRSIERALSLVTQQTRPYDKDSPLAGSLKTTSRLIRAGMSTQVYIIHAGQFDTHHRQQEVHAQQLDELFQGVYSFYRELQDAGDADRVCVLVISEFGRRVEPTQTGTDHGTAAPVFLIGGKVQGGMHGMAPSVTDLDADGNLLWNVDFRQIYSSILRQWFQASPSAIDDVILPRLFQPLPLFAESSLQRHPFELAPIPCNTHLTVNGAALTPTPASAVVRDINGRQVLQTTLDLQVSTRIPLPSLPSGVYVIDITTTSVHSAPMQYRTAFPVVQV